MSIFLLIFFFQAEDGIRDHCVTGVQTCALPISSLYMPRLFPFFLTYIWARSSVPIIYRPQFPASIYCYLYFLSLSVSLSLFLSFILQIGRASCRERVYFSFVSFFFNINEYFLVDFFFSSRRRHTRSLCDWSSDVCSSDLISLHA